MNDPFNGSTDIVEKSLGESYRTVRAVRDSLPAVLELYNAILGYGGSAGFAEEMGQVVLAKGSVENAVAIIQLLASGMLYDTAEGGVDPTLGVGNGEFFVTWEDLRFRVYANEGGTAVLKIELPTTESLVLAQAAAATAVAARDQALSAAGAQMVESWAKALTLTGLANGAVVLVLGTDAGTHASLAGDVGASGGQTPNAGYFVYSAALPGLVRKGDLDSTLAKAAKDLAVAAAAQAQTAAAALQIEVAIFPGNPDGLTPGVHWGAAMLQNKTRFQFLDLQILEGLGTVNELTVFVDNFPVYGPVQITGQARTLPVNFIASEGSSIKFQVSDISGAITLLMARLRGVIVA